MSDTFRAMCAELVAAWDKDYPWDCVDNPDRMGALLDRTRTLLAQPEAEGLTDEELRQMLFDNHRGAIEFLCDAEEEAHLMIRNHVKFARAAIAADRSRRPALQPPADGEIDDFIHRWWEAYGKGYLPNLSDKALVADALAFWGNPTPQSPSPQSP